MPVVLEGLILAGSISAVQVRTRRARAQRLWPICVVVAGTVASIGANVVHATATALGPIECALIAGAVPLALMMTAHLLITAATPEHATKSAAAPKPARPATAAPTAKVVATAAGDVADQLRAMRAETGAWPTGAFAGALLGKSAKTGVRYLAALRAAEAA
ncbi:hypothetical protein [Conyzicola sp.]|uniref:hypothetical protein n=1 Tax=Conyzicola sp. TaxID=1969404 RepID=UPI0039890DB3